MAIRMIAEELYRLIKEVEALEKALQNAPLDKRAAIEERLRKAKAERNGYGGFSNPKRSDLATYRPMELLTKKFFTCQLTFDKWFCLD